jgi:hypothetical protein
MGTTGCPCATREGAEAAREAEEAELLDYLGDGGAFALTISERPVE